MKSLEGIFRDFCLSSSLRSKDSIDLATKNWGNFMGIRKESLVGG